MAKKVAEKSAKTKAAKPAKEKAESTVKAAAAVKPAKAPKPAKVPKPKAPKKTAKEKQDAKDAKRIADSASPQLDPRWQEYFDKHGSEKSTSYKMTGSYQANQPLQHAKLGWGYILGVQNDRLEVLFEYGPRVLISNYKG